MAGSLRLCLLLLIVPAFSTLAAAADPPPFFYILLPKVFILDYEHKVEVYVNQPTSVVVKCVAQNTRTGESKACGSNSVISKGSGSATVKVPFASYVEPSVRFNFTVQLCGSANDANCVSNADGKVLATESAEVPILKKTLLVFAETDKPVYKANDQLRIRVLALYPDILHPSRNPGDPGSAVKLKYHLIILLSPSGRRMAQWADKDWIEGLKGFTHQLTADPEYGKWKLKITVETPTKELQTDEESIEVKKYVLPQFTVQVTPPTYLLGNAKFVYFTVCATYSFGLPMRGKITAILQLKGDYTHTRPRLIGSAILDGKKKCVNFKESTIPLDLMNSRYYSRQIAVEATAVEEGTGAKVTVSELGGSLSYTYFFIVIESEDIFYHGLPYYGFARTTYPDKSPFPGAKVTIRLGSWTSRWGFVQEVTSDDKGRVYFVIPPIPEGRKSILLTISGSYPRTIPWERGRYSMYASRVSKQLYASYSPTNTSLRIKPLYKMAPQDPCTSGNFKFQIRSNVRLFTRRIHVVVTARGEIMYRGLIDPETDTSLPECQDTDSEEGHFKCKQKTATDRGFLVTCLVGWRGTNCLFPLCTQRCEKGVCGIPNKCFCQEGWSGPNCTTCLRLWGCENGCCSGGNDCKCYRGWGGQYCSEASKTDEKYYYTTKYNMKVPCLNGCKETIPKYYVYDKDKVEIANIYNRVIIVPWSKAMSPTAKVLVYFEYKNEIVSDSLEVSGLTSCFEKAAPTSFKFSSSEVRPGASLTGVISTSGTNVVCALSIADIAMTVFGSTGGATSEEVLEHFKKLMQKITGYHSRDYYRTHASHLCQIQRAKETVRRRKRKVMAPWFGGNNLRDSSRAFSDANVIVLSNFKVIQKPCEQNHMYLDGPVMMEAAAAGGAADASLRSKTTSKADSATSSASKEEVKEVMRPKVRSFFPESWKFLTVEVTGSTASLNLDAPHSVTSWQALMYCISSLGLGISQPALLKVFQPFFVQMVLPYSLIRDEVAEIPIKVFNYIEHCYEIKLTMKPSSDFTIVGHNFEEFCICAFERKTAYIRIKATVLKKISIEVTATPLSSSRGLCKRPVTPSSVPSLTGDAVRRELLVEPEGVLQQKSTGDVICAPATNKVLQLDLSDIQSALVPGSARAYLFWSGDILGPALENLDRLVRMPYGCGEQNMATVIPSILVLGYLTHTGIDNKELKAKALNFINIGYTRQQMYRFTDGSYAAFRRPKGRGSTLLTSLVLSSFATAQQYTSAIETSTLTMAVTFLLSKQDSKTGCFREDGKVFHHSLKGGLASASDQATLTAYVLGCLLEARDNAGIKSSLEKGITEAVKCITSNSPSSLSSMSSYSLALRAYALTRWKPADAVTTRYVNELKSRVVTKGSYSYIPDFSTKPSYFNPWVRYSTVEVEMTGYLVRTLYYLSSSPNLMDLLPYLRWLVQQRNDRGGFGSTQDTILALKSLTDGGKLMAGGSSGSINLDLKIKRSDSSSPINYKVTPTNKMLFNQQSIDPSAKVEIDATGNGCAVVQINLLFNVKNFEEHAKVSPFTATASVEPTSTGCDKAKVNACMEYKPPRTGAKATMVMMKAKMASGWKVEAASLSSLQESTSSGSLQRAEEDSDKSLNLYYEPEEKKSCAFFNIEQFVKVDAKPMIVMVYDYYLPEQSVEVSVSVYTGKCKDAGTFKETSSSSTECATCALDQSSVENALKTQCEAETYAVALGTRKDTTSSSWTFELNPGNGMIKGWTGALTVRSGCTCNVGKEVVLISRQKEYQAYGKPIDIDGSWVAIEPKHIKEARSKLSAKCQEKWGGFPFSYYYNS